MSRHRVLIGWLLSLWCVATVSVVRGQDILDNVPRDALGFVVVRNLTAVTDTISKLSAPNGASSITPAIDVLLAAIDPNGGLDRQGDLLIVARASDRPLEESPLAVWLPVGDYGRFVRGLAGNPEERITVVTVLGEDVLCANHRGKWALIMDADQRQRMEEVLSRGPEPPPRVAALRDWLASNQMAVAVLPTEESRARLRGWAREGAEPAAGAESTVRVLGLQGEESPSLDFLTRLRRSAGHVLATFPKLASLVLESDTIAIGARSDASGSFFAGVRMAWPQDRWENARDANSGPPVLHREGEFTFSGGGRFPRTAAKAVAECFLRQAMLDMRRDNPRATFDQKLIDRFVESSLEAATRVTAASVFHTPGTEQDGVYTNHFLAVRVDSVEAFQGQISRAVEVWNELSKTAQPSTQSMFETESVAVDGRRATQYTLDIAASEGFPDEPYMRELMERLFGPDRKLHRLVVPVDERTALLGGGTAAQAAAAVKALTAAESTGWTAANTAAANHLLPAQADWRLFFGPATYTKWLKRTSLVTHGEIVGGTPLEQFPQTPPIAVAGGFPAGELWVDAVVPAETLREGAAYFHRRWEYQRAAR